MLSDKQMSELEKREKLGAEFFEFARICIDEGWSSARCLEGCIVEVDGVCPHNFKSFLLEYGFV